MGRDTTGGGTTAKMRNVELAQTDSTKSRYVVLTKHDKRPHMLGIHQSSGIKIFGLTFLDSPQFHVYLTDVENVHVNHINVTVDVEAQSGINKRQRGLKLRTSSNPFLFPSAK